MTRRLHLREDPPASIDMRRIPLQSLCMLPNDRLQRETVRIGKAHYPLADLFAVEGPASEDVILSGATARLDFIGAGMQSGRLTVEGDAGLFAGMGMAAGRLDVHGNAGSGVAAGMKGGIIRIHGDVADDCGGPGEAAPHGMSGGTVVVLGNAAGRLAHKLRRGTIIVQGTTGPGACTQMIAGTVISLGGFAESPGQGMRRGTILSGQPLGEQPSWFTAAENYTSSFTRLLAKKINPLLEGKTLPLEIRYRRMLGDITIGGQGEVLVAELN